jgi:hypothetical protein
VNFRDGIDLLCLGCCVPEKVGQRFSLDWNNERRQAAEATNRSKPCGLTQFLTYSILDVCVKFSSRSAAATHFPAGRQVPCALFLHWAKLSAH